MPHGRTRSSSRWSAAVFACLLVGAFAPPVNADHTPPNDPLTQIVDLGDESVKSGAGTWTHVKNFAGTTGTDLEFFHRNGELYAAGGQLGQAGKAVAGQRILKLVNAAGEVAPEFVADHGSGSCGDVTNARSTTGLQHDTQTTPRAANILAPGAKPDAELVIDTVDALGRCHDSAGGGLEFIDVSGLGTDGFEAREVHLTRHNGYSHTVTVDATRPWIVYNSTSNFGTDPDSENPMGIGPAWIDVMDIRTCLGLKDKTLAEKRALCRPKVFRIPFDYAWATQEKEAGGFRQPSGCHDITARPGKIYCAALNATIAFDVSGLTEAQGPDVPLPTESEGDIAGKPLPCTVVPAVPAANTAPTAAEVTDCALGAPNDVPLMLKAWKDAGRPAATGWKYLGHVNHPGRNCQNAPANDCNTNTVTPSDEGVAVSHEADPSPDGRWLFVTDERGGGIVPPGAMCAPTIDNPYGNGGLHVFDMAKTDDQGRFQYAEMAGGGKAVYITANRLLSPTFCTIHVIEQIPDEQRIVAAWYSQGIKILDYQIDPGTGQWTFTEVASYALIPNDIWAAETFKIEDHEDGTRTYWMLSNDVARGIDVFSWTGPRGPAIQKLAIDKDTTTGPDKDDDDDKETGGGTTPTGPTKPRAGGNDDRLAATGTDLGLLALAVLLLPLAVLVRRRVSRV